MEWEELSVNWSAEPLLKALKELGIPFEITEQKSWQTVRAGRVTRTTIKLMPPYVFRFVNSYSDKGFCTETGHDNVLLVNTITNQPLLYIRLAGEDYAREIVKVEKL